ncbi:polyribonucleotide nucleotidyltransferase [Mollicutes bacterium LVI A0075]|nr:polyribonucleotide nucleotidyltransferase [Mollicutes bacterium LVI A0075]
MQSIYKLEIGGRDLEVTLGKFAKQATGSAMVAYGDTQILATSVLSKREEDRGFFPLVVNYEEKLYATGKVPGSFSRREGRPSDNATLAARLIDRPIRPLFPDGYQREIQIVTTVMSLDKDNEPEVTAINAASIALSLSASIPFEGPIGAVHIGRIDGNFIVNPTVEERETSDLELRVAGTADAINMVEAKANELSEAEIADAILLAHEEIKKIVAFQNQIKAELGIETATWTREVHQLEAGIESKIETTFNDQILEAMKIETKQEKAEKLSEVEELIVADFGYEDEEEEKLVRKLIDKRVKQIFRDLIIHDNHRPDGRVTTEVRALSSETELLKRAHGSALFTRGETQALAAVTLGMKMDGQLLDGFELESEKLFMLHYNFPPYSVGETGRIGSPGRREIGHGNLAEKALSIVIPKYDEFPYTVRVVSEILESNGSSSQATVCAGSMALMQAGVPIKKQVAGIAMGLIGDDEGSYTILTDIQGLEDHLGDMDFKVAGTNDGICAIQMDIKIKGITKEILTEALEQARIGRLHILDHMNETIAAPNTELSEHAPKIDTLQIKPAKIKDVIGKGGDTINKIIDETGVKIDIEDDGLVAIYGIDNDMMKRARQIIEEIVKEYEVGQVFTGKVTRIEKFGAFVKFDTKGDALVHISDLAKGRVEKTEDVVQVDQEVEITIKEIDNKGRIKAKLNYEE